VKAGTVTVKVRDTGFHTITRQKALAEPSDLTEPIWRAAVELARPEIRGKKIRLLGVTASHLGEREQLGLFEALDPKRRRAVEAADELRRRFGPRAVTRARLLRSGLPAPFERDFGTAAERRGEHAADVTRSGRKRPDPPPPPAPDPGVDIDVGAPEPDVVDVVEATEDGVTG
jgi:nucleotidyltransferase/DNA polymerase involved in DNA repair